MWRELNANDNSLRSDTKYDDNLTRGVGDRERSAISVELMLSESD